MIVVVFSLAIVTLLVACTLHCCQLRRRLMRKRAHVKQNVMHYPMPVEDNATMTSSIMSQRPWGRADSAEMSDLEDWNISNNASESEDRMHVTTFEAANPNSERNRCCVVDHLLCGFRATEACERVSGRRGSQQIKSNEALVIFPSGGDSFTQTSNKTRLLPPFRRQADKRPTRSGVKQRLTRCGVKQRLTISNDRSNNADDKIDDTPPAETDEINQPTSSSSVSKQVALKPNKSFFCSLKKAARKESPKPGDKTPSNSSFYARQFIKISAKVIRSKKRHIGEVHESESKGTDISDQKTNSTTAETTERPDSMDSCEMNESGAFQSVRFVFVTFSVNL